MLYSSNLLTEDLSIPFFLCIEKALSCNTTCKAIVKILPIFFYQRFSVVWSICKQ